MTQRLYQGVEGMIDASQALQLMKGTGFSPYIQNARSPRALAPEGIFYSTGDPKLREECGVVAIHGHPNAPAKPISASMPCSIAARNQPASLPPTAIIWPTSKHGPGL